MDEWQRLGCASRESWQYARDHSAGYAAGRSDARALLYRSPVGASEAYAAGYERGYAWTRDHSQLPSPVLSAI